MTAWFSRHTWRFLVVAGLFALLGIAAACGGDDDNGGTSTATSNATATTAGSTGTATAAAGGALKIGALLSFTGDLGSFGDAIFNGVQMAADEINANGGVNGQDVTIVKGDDATSPTGWRDRGPAPGRRRARQRDRRPGCPAALRCSG